MEGLDPGGMINRAWGQLKDHSWPALQEKLDEYKDKAGDAEKGIVDRVKGVVGSLQASGEKFPDSPDQLKSMIMQKLGI